MRKGRLYVCISRRALAIICFVACFVQKAFPKKQWKEISVLVDDEAQDGLLADEAGSEGQDLIALELLSAGSGICREEWYGLRDCSAPHHALDTAIGDPLTTPLPCSPQRYCVELAAFNGFHLSNTLSLERAHGWKGVCIEANRDHLARLSRRRCTVVAALIAGPGTDSAEFTVAAGAETMAGIVDGGQHRSDAPLSETG